MRLLRQLRSTCDGTGIVSEKSAYEVFLLLNSSFQIGNGFGCGEHQLLRLPDIEHGGSPAACQRLCELQRIAARGQSSSRDFEFQVKLTKLEISCGNVADECADDSLAGPLRCQEICPRGLGGSAILSPEIEIPRQRKIDLVRTRFERRKKL